MELWIFQKTHYAKEGNPKWRGGKTLYQCAHCKIDFLRYAHSVKNRKNVFCSKKCHDDFRRFPVDENRLRAKDMRGKLNPRWTGNKYCKVCEKELFETRSRRVLLCSEECKHKAKVLAFTGSKNPRWIDKKYHCRRCGEEITHKGRTHLTFCSKSCAFLWQSENLSGVNSPIYDGGTKPYPPEWNSYLRRQIKKRDGYKCVRCGDSGNKLHVHHIDHNKMNCNLDNLATLCQSCHMSYHAKLRGKQNEETKHG